MKGSTIRVSSHSGMNRKVGQTIEVAGPGGGIVAVGTIVAVLAGVSGAVTLLVKVLAGG